jgi:hypothetical protein
LQRMLVDKQALGYRVGVVSMSIAGIRRRRRQAAALTGGLLRTHAALQAARHSQQKLSMYPEKRPMLPHSK